MLYRTLVIFRSRNGRSVSLRGLVSAPSTMRAKEQALRHTTPFARENLISIDVLDVDTEAALLGKPRHERA